MQYKCMNYDELLKLT